MCFVAGVSFGAGSSQGPHTVLLLCPAVSSDWPVFYDVDIFEKCSQQAIFRASSSHLEIVFLGLIFASTLKDIFSYGSPLAFKINQGYG